jgi:hypothetical protein
MCPPSSSDFYSVCTPAAAFAAAACCCCLLLVTLQLGPLAAAMCGMMLLKPFVIARVFVQVG